MARGLHGELTPKNGLPKKDSGCQTLPLQWCHQMNGRFMNAEGMTDILSNFSVAETMDRLESLLRARGAKIFARIDQAAEAQAVGLTMPQTQLLIFGDPKGGTPLMVKYPSLALDLPLKALIWEAADGKVWLSYNSPEYLKSRHHLEAAPFRAVTALFQAAASNN
jgi:uncharacterized protein (DUF302 family)